jgi:hypothetical protein
MGFFRKPCPQIRCPANGLILNQEGLESNLPYLIAPGAFIPSFAAFPRALGALSFKKFRSDPLGNPA